MEPLKFKPILKSTLWGGERIARFKQIGNVGEPIGESWELSGMLGDESVVANGNYEGMTLTEVIKETRHELLGVDNYERFGDRFPLLVKFIDADRDLSIQVHPDDEAARRRGLENGKTEMWYMMDSAPEARIYCGIKEKMTPEEYRRKVEDGTICDAIAEYKACEDDCFFIPAGRVHCIGKGCFLAEIQQASDTTYRIYDFKRRDKDGNYRQLHTQEAAECIDFNVENDCRLPFSPSRNEAIQLVSCDYFTTAVYDLDEPMMLDYEDLDSFVVLIGLKGDARIVDNEGNETTFREGETLLVPASTTTLVVSGTIKFLETYV